MRTIYIDSEFKCRVTDDGTMTAVSTDFFDGKCDNFVEGYRLIPAGNSWTREDGTVIHGLTVFPWKNYEVLQAYQEQYVAMSAEMEDMQTALSVLGVVADG